MIKPKFYGKMENGVLHIDNDEALGLYLKKFKDGTEIEMTVSRKYKRRTSGQPGEGTNFNGYWWAVIIRMVSDQMGEMDDEYTHNLILLSIGHYKETDGVKVPLPTKSLSGGEFADLCMKARVWASQSLNLSIPEPNEAVWE